jgi:Ca-activated chloride channel family protein
MLDLLELFSQLHFIRPTVLWLLPVVLFIIWHLQRNQSKDEAWSKICDPHLLDAIKVEEGNKGSRWSLLLWPIAIISLLAIAGPAYKKLPIPVIKNQSALIVILDVSRSMLATDIKPNRLERAKFKISDILEQRKDGQTALLVYAGDAFVVTPLTDDTETIALMLKAISPNIMPVQGSRVDIALGKAQDLLTQAGYISGDVLVISDGVNLSRAKSVVKELLESNIKTSVLAVGTKQGSPIPTQNGFVKDKSGNIVIPKLQTSALSQLAAAGNGRFAIISGDSSDVDYLAPKVSKDNGQTKSEEDSFETAKYIDEGPWLALLLLPFVALLFRKGLLLSLMLVVGLQTPESSYAFEWQDMWLNADQKAAKQINQGEHEQALATAKSDQWKAVAAYKGKEFDQAKELFNDGSADGFYNQGNSLAQKGQLKQALEAYEKSLKIRPDDEDTLYNKEQVEKALEQQEQQDQENKDQQDQDQENKDQENKDQQQSEDQQSDQDQEDKEQQQGDKQQQNEDEGDNPEQQEKEQQQSEMTDEEKQQQQKEQEELDKADKEAEEKQKQGEKEQQEQQEQQVQLSPEELAEDAENKEAIEQWLRRIPDDPGGLLRRKFYYQYNQQNNKPDEQQDW